MRAEQRLFRTTDGRLVADGHQDAAFLAYLPGDDVAEKDAAQLKPQANKSRSKPADKAAPKPDDK